MKAFKLLTLLPLVLSLSSCGETQSKEGAPLIELSGSFAFDAASISGYEDVATKRDASTLIAEAEAGIPTYVLFARESCSYCQKFEPYFIGAMKKIYRNIYVYYYTDDGIDDRAFVMDALNTLQTKYGKDESKGGISGAVPSIYYLDGTKANLMDMYEDNNSVYKFSSYMQYETKASSFYRFSDFETFKTANNEHNDVRTVLYDSSDTESQTKYSSLFSSSSSIKTYVLDYGVLTPNEKSEALNCFGLSSYSFTVI